MNGRWWRRAAPVGVALVVAGVALGPPAGTDQQAGVSSDDPRSARPVVATADVTLASAPSGAVDRGELEAFLRQLQTAEVVTAAAQEAAEGAPPAPERAADADPLACIRAHESDTAGGYAAVSPDGTYRGAYQFHPSTWNATAAAADRPDLVGVDPATVSPADQDAIASHLYSQAGSQPWGGRC